MSSKHVHDGENATVCNTRATTQRSISLCTLPLPSHPRVCARHPARRPQYHGLFQSPFGLIPTLIFKSAPHQLIKVSINLCIPFLLLRSFASRPRHTETSVPSPMHPSLSQNLQSTSLLSARAPRDLSRRRRGPYCLV